jgi:Raf kinase inhibitor-like YbhB/YbcL family protein
MKRLLSRAWRAAAAALLASTSAAAADFRLTSPAFAEGGEIPVQYTCEGGSTSPPLAWSDPPAGTQSFVLSVSDPDAPDPAAPRMTWVHWVVYGLPADLRALPEGASRKLPPGARHALNDWKSPDYGGPCPPKGRHRYVFKLFALDVPPSNRGSIPHANLGRFIKSHVIGSAQLVGTYEKRGR